MMDALEFLRKKEREAYRTFREMMEDPEATNKDRVRFKYEWYVIADLLDEYEDYERTYLDQYEGRIYDV